MFQHKISNLMEMLPPLRKRFCRSLTLLVLLLTEGLAATKGLMLSML